MELEKWKEKNKEAKKYAHFDEKVSLNKVWNYISKPENIMKKSLINIRKKMVLEK